MGVWERKGEGAERKEIHWEHHLVVDATNYCRVVLFRALFRSQRDPCDGENNTHTINFNPLKLKKYNHIK